MEFRGIPTSKDIYLEADGRKIAVVQSYLASATQEITPIEAFGTVNPVEIIRGKINYTLQLKRVMLISAQDEVDFYQLSDFVLVIVKPNYQIIYRGCEWKDISELGDLNHPCIETVTITAAKRIIVRLQNE